MNEGPFILIDRQEQTQSYKRPNIINFQLARLLQMFNLHVLQAIISR